MKHSKCTYHLPTRLLAGPLDFPATAYNFFHPEPDSRRQTHCQRNQSLQSATKHLADDYCSDDNANAQDSGTLLQLSEHRLISDGRCGVEKNVSLFAVDGYVGGGAFCNWVWWCGHILRFFVVREGL
jgi:hypothetical protein